MTAIISPRYNRTPDTTEGLQLPRVARHVCPGGRWRDGTTPTAPEQTATPRVVASYLGLSVFCMRQSIRKKAGHGMA